MVIDFRVQQPKQRRAEQRPDYMMRYNDVFDLGAVSYTPQTLLQKLDEAGIHRAVMQAEWASGDYRQDNDLVAGLVRDNAEKLIGFAAVDIGDCYSAVQELKRSVETLGLRGLNLQPFASRLHANDKKAYPLYSKCLEYGIPVCIHTGINYSADRGIDYGRPIYIDEVACDFPGLPIVLNHGGWPWVSESVAIARKHRNVYIEIGGISPKYIAKPGAGWEMLLTMANNLLREQILFATDSMLPFERAISEARALPLSPDAIDAIMAGNAQRIIDTLPR
jgi:predicted TIM-barrel fold metal-dependent hydrolase